MKKILFLLVLALTALSGQAQVACNSLVTLDQAGLFHDTAIIAKAASGLIDQGADVHVVSISRASPSGLIVTMEDLQTTCPSWRGKANLFVLIIAPTEYKKNVFFGAAYAAAFHDQDTVNLIYSQAANPFYKSGDFSGGTAAALRDFGAKVAAYHDQQKHPPAATDLHGLWTVCYLVLILLCLVGLVWLVFRVLGNSKKEEELRLAAQSSAIKARDRATRLYRSNPNSNTTLSQRLLDLTNSISADPDTADLTAQQYLTIRDLWNDFADDVVPARDTTAKTSPHHYSRRPSGWRESTKSTAGGGYPLTSSQPSGTDYPVRTYAPAPPTVVVRDSGSSDVALGMLIGENMSRHEREVVYEEPRHRDPDPEPDRSRSFSSGSDSSWGSSDSSSSSDFSSGSDSSW